MADEKVQCPLCGGAKVRANAFVKVSSGDGGPLQATKRLSGGHPRANRSASDVSAYVCSHCGHTTLFVEQPQVLI